MKLNVVFMLLGISLASAAFAAAPPVKPNPAAVEAVALVFLGPEPDRTRNLARSRQDLAVGALRAPAEERTANVLLSRGLTGVGVQALLEPRGMDLVSFEAKEVQDTVAEFRAVAMSPEFAVYRLQVVGTREALHSLLGSPVVNAVLVNEDESAVATFRMEKAELESRVIVRGPRIRMGPVDPNKPLPEPCRLTRSGPIC